MENWKGGEATVSIFRGNKSEMRAAGSLEECASNALGSASRRLEILAQASRAYTLAGLNSLRLAQYQNVRGGGESCTFVMIFFFHSDNKIIHFP